MVKSTSANVLTFSGSLYPFTRCGTDDSSLNHIICSGPFYANIVWGFICNFFITFKITTFYLSDVY